MDEILSFFRLCRLFVLFCVALTSFAGIYAQNESTGSIRVDSEPSGAEIRIDGVLQEEVTPALISGIQVGQHSISLLKEDYAPAIERILIRSGSTSEVFMELSADFGIIGILTSPEAAIIIDDVEVGFGSYFGRVSEGDHFIEARLENYDVELKKVTVGIGQEVKVNFRMHESTGTLAVKCIPTRTAVYLDDELKGYSPLTIPDIVVGTHQIRFESSGYRTVEREVQISKNQTTTMTDQLIKGGVEISVDTDPPEAELYLDRDLVGQSPLTWIVEGGSHELVVKKEDYNELRQQISISSDKNYSFLLERLKTEVTFRSTPEKASVLIDQKKYGVTGQSFDVEYGEKTIRMEKPGFKSAEMVFDFDKQTRDINYLLYPVKYRRKAPAICYSLLWPGAGQSYLNRGSWHLVFGAIGYGMIGGSFVLYQSATDNYDLYQEETDAVQRESLKESWQSEIRNANILLIAAGVTWGLNMVWTMILPDEASKYERYKLNATFDNQSGTAQIGMAIRFTP